MSKPKTVIGIGIVMIVAASIWMAIVSNPISGIVSFFVLTCLLWAIARTRRWI